jgi:hypothetical protein
MTVQVSLNFSFSKEGLRVRHFVTSDRDVVSFFENLKEDLEREKNLEQVVRMGVVALKSISLGNKMDYVEKGFNTFESRTKDRFTQFESKIAEVFSNSDSRTKDRFTQIESKIAEVFGEHGIFSNLLKEHFGENGTIVRDLFDPSKIGTPMYFFKQEVMKEIGSIKAQLEIKKGVEELRQTTTLKGFDFQKYFHNTK